MSTRVLKPFFYFTIVILLLFPLVYLVIASSDSQPPVRTVTTEQSHDLSMLEKIAAKDPTSPNLQALALEYLNRKEPGKAVGPLKKALALSPADPLIFNNLAVAHTMLQQYREAIAAGERAVQLDPSFNLAKNNLQWARDEMKNVRNQISALEKTTPEKRSPDDELTRGLLYFKCGDYDESIKIWAAIAEADPKNYAALNNIGTAFMMKNQPADAVALFEKIVNEAPENQLARNNLAWALSELELLKK
jgi:tetratricopeptide (TPR) repeat protein